MLIPWKKNLFYLLELVNLSIAIPATTLDLLSIWNFVCLDRGSRKLWKLAYMALFGRFGLSVTSVFLRTSVEISILFELVDLVFDC